MSAPKEITDSTESVPTPVETPAPQEVPVAAPRTKTRYNFEKYAQKSNLEKFRAVLFGKKTRLVAVWGSIAATLVITVGLFYVARPGNSEDLELDEELSFLEADAPAWNPPAVEPESGYAYTESPFDEMTDPQAIENSAMDSGLIPHVPPQYGARQAVHFSENDYDPVRTVEHHAVQEFSESRLPESRPAAWLAGVIEEDFESSFEQGSHARFRQGSR